MATLQVSCKSFLINVFLVFPSCNAFALFGRMRWETLHAASYPQREKVTFALMSVTAPDFGVCFENGSAKEVPCCVRHEVSNGENLLILRRTA